MVDREAQRFTSGGEECAAWHYPTSNGAMVVMGVGLGVTKEVGTDRFAARFARAGFGVLAFDYRHFGESDGSPRQVARIRDQLDDFRAAFAFARRLPGVDPDRVAIWGFSVAGGYVVRLAAELDGLAAAISQAGNVDGTRAAVASLPHWTPASFARTNVRAMRDLVRASLGRPRLLVPLAGRRGEVAALTTPDAGRGSSALNPDGRYEWRQEVAAWSAMSVAFQRPIRRAKKVGVPMLVLAYDDDGVTTPGPAVRAARLAGAELVRLPGGHYEGYLGGHERAVEVQLDFLGRTLVGGARDVAERQSALR
ncbi:MAG: alpha/beta fold hydrolase [Thermoleophilaceae bacterium]